MKRTLKKQMFLKWNRRRDPNEKKTKNTTKKMTKDILKDEKMLIMRSYISLSVKSDWDQLADNVYKSRDRYVSREMWKHYEDIHKEKA
jgi:hypothetical protein